MDKQTIENAYNNMVNAVSNYRDAELAHIAAKMELDAVRLQKTKSLEIVGKNPDEREASARELLPELYAFADTTRVNEREARAWFDICALEVERVKMLMRLEELLAGKVGG